MKKKLIWFGARTEYLGLAASKAGVKEMSLWELRQVSTSVLHLLTHVHTVTPEPKVRPNQSVRNELDFAPSTLNPAPSTLALLSRTRTRTGNAKH